MVKIDIGRKMQRKTLVKDQVLEDFCRKECTKYEHFQDLFSAIAQSKIKKYHNICKSSTKILTFVYKRINDFPEAR